MALETTGVTIHRSTTDRRMWWNKETGVQGTRLVVQNLIGPEYVWKRLGADCYMAMYVTEGERDIGECQN